MRSYEPALHGYFLISPFDSKSKGFSIPLPLTKYCRTRPSKSRYTYSAYAPPHPIIYWAEMAARGPRTCYAWRHLLEKVNAQRAISSILIGERVMLFTTFILPNPLGIMAGLWGLIAALIIFVAASLTTAPTKTTAAVIESLGGFFAAE